MKYTVDQQAINRAIRKIQNKSDAALKYCGEHLAEKISQQLKEDSYDLGTLAGSIDYRLVRHGLVEVGSALAYAPVMEYGRQPGKFPPLDSLVGWVSRKHMIPEGNATKKYDDLYYKDKGVVYVIARGIARNGIKGKHTFENVMNRERKNIQKFYIEFMKS